MVVGENEIAQVMFGPEWRDIYSPELFDVAIHKAIVFKLVRIAHSKFVAVECKTTRGTIFPEGANQSNLLVIGELV